MHDFGLMLSWIKMTIRNQWCTKMLVQNSAQAAAAAVPKSPDLARAVAHSTAAQAKQRHLHAEISTLTKRRDGLLLTVSDTAAIDARLFAIGAELRSAETERLAAFRDVEHHRPAHAAAVKAALSQRRRDAAARAVAAIAALQKATAELHETAAAITAAGGHARQIPSFPLIDGLQKIAKTIEREA